MKDEDRGIHLGADLKASTAVTKQAGLTWPVPADRRLDQLVELANDAGAKTHRNELAAAIVTAAEADGDVLLQLVLDWRRSKVRDVIVNPATRVLRDPLPQIWARTTQGERTVIARRVSMTAGDPRGDGRSQAQLPGVVKASSAPVRSSRLTVSGQRRQPA